MKVRTLSLTGLVILAVLTSTVGWAEAPLTNADVIRMVEAGLSSNAIVDKIKTAETAFRLDTNGLVELAQAKVPDEVIRAMLARQAAGQPQPTPQAPKTATPTPSGNPAMQLLGKNVVRSTGLCSARGDLLATDSGLRFEVVEGATLCQGGIFPKWSFNVRWDELDSVCFEYVVMGALVIKNKAGRDYTIKDTQPKVQAIEDQLRGLKPDLRYHCD